VLYALLFLPALVAIAFVVTRRKEIVLAETIAPAPELSGEADPLAALDALLAELERTTARIEGDVALDEEHVRALEALVEQLERVGDALQPALAHRDDVEADD
jgi:exonuclease VII small subunit